MDGYGWDMDRWMDMDGYVWTDMNGYGYAAIETKSATGLQYIILILYLSLAEFQNHGPRDPAV